MIKSFGLILILVTIPANSQLDNVLLETVKSTLSQKLLEFNTTTHQLRNNTDELCIYQLEEVVNSVAKLQNWALKSNASPIFRKKFFLFFKTFSFE